MIGVLAGLACVLIPVLCVLWIQRAMPRPPLTFDDFHGYWVTASNGRTYWYRPPRIEQLTVTITADVSGFVAAMNNLGASVNETIDAVRSFSQAWSDEDEGGVASRATGEPGQDRAALPPTGVRHKPRLVERPRRTAPALPRVRGRFPFSEQGLAPVTGL